MAPLVPISLQTPIERVDRSLLVDQQTTSRRALCVNIAPHELLGSARGLSEYSKSKLACGDKVGLIQILASACQFPDIGVLGGNSSVAGRDDEEHRRKRRKVSKDDGGAFMANAFSSEAVEDNGDDASEVEEALGSKVPKARSQAYGMRVTPEGDTIVAQRNLMFFEVVRKATGEPWMYRYWFVSQDPDFCWDRYITNLININAKRKLKNPRRFAEEANLWAPHRTLVSHEDWVRKYLSTVKPSLVDEPAAYAQELASSPASVHRVLGADVFFQQSKAVLRAARQRVLQRLRRDSDASENEHATTATSMIAATDLWVPSEMQVAIREARATQLEVAAYIIKDMPGVNSRDEDMIRLSYRFPFPEDVYAFGPETSDPLMLWVTAFPHIKPDASLLAKMRDMTAKERAYELIRDAKHAAETLSRDATDEMIMPPDRVEMLAEANKDLMRNMSPEQLRAWRADPQNWRALQDAMCDGSESMQSVASYFREMSETARQRGMSGPPLFRHRVVPKDATLTQMQNWILGFFDGLDKHYELRGNHDTMLWLLVVSLCVFAYNDLIQPHTALTGAPGGGKSYLMEILKTLLLPETVLTFTKATNRVFETENDQDQRVLLFDELGRFFLGLNEKGEGDASGDPAWKSLLSSAIMDLTFFHSDKQTGRRRGIRILKRMHSALVGGSNDKRADMPAPILSRIFVRDILHVYRPYGESSDIDVMRALADFEAHVSRLREQTAGKTAFRDELRDLLLLTILALQAIRVGLLPEPEMGVYSMCQWRFKMKLEAQGFGASDDRKLARMKSGAYVLTVMQAVLDVFWVGQPNKQFQMSDLQLLAGRMCTDIPVSAVAMSMHFDQFVDTVEGPAMQGLASAYNDLRTKPFDEWTVPELDKCFRRSVDPNDELYVRYESPSQNPSQAPTSSEAATAAMAALAQVHSPYATTETPLPQRRVLGSWDVSYVRISDVRKNHHMPQREVAAAKAAAALRRRKMDFTTEQMVHRINDLCDSRMFNGFHVLRMDENAHEVLILRSWLETTYVSGPFELLQKTMQVLSHPYVRPHTRLLTMHPSEIPATKTTSGCFLYHLPRVVELVPSKTKWAFPGSPVDIIGGDPEVIIAERSGLLETHPQARQNRWLKTLEHNEVIGTALQYPETYLGPLTQEYAIRATVLGLSPDTEPPASVLSRLRVLQPTSHVEANDRSSLLAKAVARKTTIRQS